MILNSANYLIQLYYKTSETYKLTRFKLNYLLVIAEICHMKKKDRLYSVPISFYYNEDCKFRSLGFQHFIDFYVSDIIPGKVPENTIVDKDINYDFECFPNYYKNIGSITDDEKELLEKIFYNFGNFSSAALRILLEDFFNSLIESYIINEEKRIYYDFKCHMDKDYMYCELSDSSFIKNFFNDEYYIDYLNSPLISFISSQNDYSNKNAMFKKRSY